MIKSNYAWAGCGMDTDFISCLLNDVLPLASMNLLSMSSSMQRLGWRRDGVRLNAGGVRLWFIASRIACFSVRPLLERSNEILENQHFLNCPQNRSNRDSVTSAATTELAANDIDIGVANTQTAYMQRTSFTNAIRCGPENVWNSEKECEAAAAAAVAATCQCSQLNTQFTVDVLIICMWSIQLWMQYYLRSENDIRKGRLCYWNMSIPMRVCTNKCRNGQRLWMLIILLTKPECHMLFIARQSIYYFRFNWCLIGIVSPMYFMWIQFGCWYIFLERFCLHRV